MRSLGYNCITNIYIYLYIYIFIYLYIYIFLYIYLYIQVDVESRTDGARICVPAWNAVVTAKSAKAGPGL